MSVSLVTDTSVTVAVTDDEGSFELSEYRLHIPSLFFSYPSLRTLLPSIFTTNFQHFFVTVVSSVITGS